jgi:hypothetical protein
LQTAIRASLRIRFTASATLFSMREGWLCYCVVYRKRLETMNVKVKFKVLIKTLKEFVYLLVNSKCYLVIVFLTIF